MAELWPASAVQVTAPVVVSELVGKEETAVASQDFISPKQDGVYLLMDTLGVYIEQESFPKGARLVVENVRSRPTAEATVLAGCDGICYRNRGVAQYDPFN